MRSLQEQFRFFHQHAGCVVGRAAECALALARDETRAGELGLVFEWSEDEQPDLSWCEQCTPPRGGIRNRREQEHREQHCLWICEAKLDGETVAQLCGIDFGVGRDPWMRDPYKRVVEAELAGEALACFDALEHVG